MASARESTTSGGPEHATSARKEPASAGTRISVRVALVGAARDLRPRRAAPALLEEADAVRARVRAGVSRAGAAGVAAGAGEEASVARGGGVEVRVGKGREG